MMNLLSVVLGGILSVSIATSVAAQNGFESWSVIDQDKAALILKMPDMKGRTLLVQGLKGENLDILKWESDLPLLRRYILTPGKYEIRFNPSTGFPEDSYSIDLKGGVSKLLEIEPPMDASQGKVMLEGWNPGSPEFKSILEQLSIAGYAKVSEISTELTPPGNVLYVNTDLPWSVTPPPK